MTACEWCGAELDEVDDPVDACEDSCDCPPCELERAAQDDYDAWVDRCLDD